MSQGWIKLHRQMTEWEWYSDINTFRLFIHLLLVVNHKDNKFRGKVIKRGQTNRSLETLSKETGLTVRQIRTSLTKLKPTRELTQQREGNLFVISVTNYDQYQENDTGSVTPLTPNVPPPPPPSGI